MLPQIELTRYQKICLNGLINDDVLTDFDRGFLTDFTEKLDKYKRHTYISDKQEEQFDRIEKYLREELGHDYED